jgi:hypothetical protein
MAARQFRWFTFVSLGLLASLVLAACSGPSTTSAPTATPTVTASPTRGPIATASGPTPTPLAALPSPTSALPVPTSTATAAATTVPAATVRPTGTTAAQRPTDPASVIRFAATTTSAVHSFRFTATSSTTVAGKTPPTGITTTGEFVLPDRLHATTSVNGSSTLSIDAFETTKIGSDVYLHLPASIAPNGKDQWVLLDSVGSIFQEVVGAKSTSQNPLDAVAILNGLQNVQTIGDETVNGAATTHYRGTARATSAGQGNAISNFINGIISRVQETTTTVDVWVGTGDNLVRRIGIVNSTRLDFGNIGIRNGATPAATAASGTGGTQNALTFEFKDFDAPLTIAPPATFARFSDLFGALDPSALLPPRAPAKPQV